ncbi:hypothetical protein MMC26_005497 [Xylographa opegraphella]|nr:hypothetical protein [Xylographa opegraphella]
MSRLVAFVQLFFQHSGIAITQNEIADAHPTGSVDARPQLIPKIIHQVFHDWKFHNQTMPSDWDEVRQTCIDSNKGWEYRLWTEQSSRELIETHYPWFLSTYDGYKFPVQRVDAVRYFILLKYGGIYLDLDNVRSLDLVLSRCFGLASYSSSCVLTSDLIQGCLRDLTPLLYYPTWTTDGGRGALSNNILASIPNHPFWVLLTNSLIPYNYNYFFPYVTISYASGQWFETAVWQAYHRTAAGSSPENRLHRVMMDDRPGVEPWIFFTQERGGTWVNWDNYFFLWIGDHLPLLGVGLCILVAFIWWAGTRCAWCCSERSHARKGYAALGRGRPKREGEDA